ncbi:Hypothetical protein PBC10988_5820 [Planctomycetales bacterium 10988]|nr:Hypothetical protein PBC10988_5820 [Planctomycetales bacterium 10988]
MSDYHRAIVALSMQDPDTNLVKNSLPLIEALGVKTVYVTHLSVNTDLPDDESLAQGLEPVREEILEQARDLAKQVPEWSKEIEVEVVATPNASIKSLLEFAKDKDIGLICLSSGAEKPSPLSRQAVRLAHRAFCSIFVAPDAPFFPFQKIFVPVDFSKSSGEAMRWAVKIAEYDPAAKIVAQHTYDVPTGFERSGSSFDEFAGCLLDTAKKRWERFKSDYDVPDSVSIRYDLIPHSDRHHESSKYIVSAAEEEDADLVLCGSRGKSGLASIVVGSVAESLLEKLPLPMFCVRERKERMGLIEALFGFEKS